MGGGCLMPNHQLPSPLRLPLLTSSSLTTLGKLHLTQRHQAGQLVPILVLVILFVVFVLLVLVLLVLVLVVLVLVLVVLVLVLVLLVRMLRVPVMVLVLQQVLCPPARV